MADLNKLEAYELLEERKLADINSMGYRLRHKKTGARVALIKNEDENKVFYVGFRTPPNDSTGVAHIVEHTVLCGSEKFPVKDPFVELAKGSLNTFLNAMTYPDKTVYPVASCNDKDFANLMDVYLDAVFHPNIYKYEEIFKQEGWHYELENEEAPVTINGVVYNEMKGAFSSADSVLDRSILNSLFPDNAYGNESGGDPDDIPDLTYEAYKDFHSRYYHPSNSYIYLYGDMDMAEKLEWIDREYLSAYDALTIESSITEQKAFTEPKEVVMEYPIAGNEPMEDNTYLSYNMVIGDILDKQLCVAYEVLEYVLLNAPGAPVKQALLDEGIGKDIIGSYDDGILQPTFSIIAKNANEEQKEEFLRVIRESLEKIVAEGIEKKTILARLNSMEFRYREADFGSYPKGLMYGLQCLDSWLYDENEPFLYTELLDTFATLKDLAMGRYFEDLIETYLLQNTHVSVVINKPCRGLNAKKEAELAETLQKYKESLSAEEIRQLVADTAHLKEYQEVPSSEEDLEKIPLLTREDLQTQAKKLVNTECELAGIPTLLHTVYTGGICYLDVQFDIAHIPAEDLPYVGLLKAIIGYMDTAHYAYSDLSNEINLHTGGIGNHILIIPDTKNSEKYIVRYEMRSKFLPEKAETALQLMQEMMTATDFSDEKRLYEIIAEGKSRMQMTMSSSGHTTAANRAMSYYSKTAQITELTGGIDLYRLVADLEAHYEERKEALISKLQEIIKRIFDAGAMYLNITAQEDISGLEPHLQKLKAALPHSNASRQQAEIACRQKNEGFLDASKVQYVARAGNFIQAGCAYTGAFRVLKVMLGYDYLWIHVRVKGGAYGCMSGFSRNGDAYFTSYRDPNLVKTNEVYEAAPDYVKNCQVAERDMTKYIIGAISTLDTPLTPISVGRHSMTCYLSHVTDADLQRERDELLGTTADEIRALAQAVEAMLKAGNLCVIGNEESLQAEESLFMELKDLY